MAEKNKIWGFVLIAVGVVLLFSFAADLYPEMAAGGNALNDTNQCLNNGGSIYNSTGCFDTSNNTVDFNSFPLNSLFAGDGVVFIIVAALLLFIVLAGVGLKKYGNK